MTNAFSEAYKAVYDTIAGKDHKERIKFLETVADGHITISGQEITLESVVDALNGKEPLGQEAKSARAMNALRHWYEKRTPDNERTAKYFVTQAGLTDILNHFESCLKVLTIHRLRAAFDAAIVYADTLKTETEKADMILMAAGALYNSGLQQLRDYVLEKMPAYAKKYHSDPETGKATLATDTKQLQPVKNP